LDLSPPCDKGQVVYLGALSDHNAGFAQHRLRAQVVEKDEEDPIAPSRQKEQNGANKGQTRIANTDKGQTRIARTRDQRATSLSGFLDTEGGGASAYRLLRHATRQTQKTRDKGQGTGRILGVGAPRDRSTGQLQGRPTNWNAERS
jgi:hypothetical protein